MLSRNYQVLLNRDVLTNQRTLYGYALEVPKHDSILSKDAAPDVVTEVMTGIMKGLLAKARFSWSNYTKFAYMGASTQSEHFNYVVDAVTYLTVAQEVIDKQQAVMSRNESREWQIAKKFRNIKPPSDTDKAFIAEVRAVSRLSHEIAAELAKEVPADKFVVRSFWVSDRHQRVTFAMHLATVGINVIELREGRSLRESGQYVLQGNAPKQVAEWLDVRSALWDQLAQVDKDRAELDQQKAARLRP